MKRLLACCVLLGAVACGAFLAESGDGETPGNQNPADSGAGDGTSSSEGGSSVDGSAPPGDAGTDARPAVGVTCGAAKCQPGEPCCVSSEGGRCVVGDSPCIGSELHCTRRLDCAAGELCCITKSSMLGDISSSTCVATARCPSGSDPMCNTTDSHSDTGCGAGACTAGGRASSDYNLPDAAPWAICQ